eukprot:TRINITY_DN2244_c0_g1_i1.p1 TRINITY_DN2244_c0_g1~~TRINITY_DN2244_c0_g1_i1.p1  ORF type:complete len:552 (+),score=103.27 TRINITY_DN2244_c0_g1_i1:222-1877(+)
MCTLTLRFPFPSDGLPLRCGSAYRFKDTFSTIFAFDHKSQKVTTIVFKMVEEDHSNGTFGIRALRRAGRRGLRFVTDLVERGTSPNAGNSQQEQDIENSQCQNQATLSGHDIAHITEFNSLPNYTYFTMAGKNKNGYVSTFKMLAAREANYSGIGKFSASDRCHVASRYLPTSGPRAIDNMNSRAYTGQFSSDGSLFVAGFQDRRIRVYDVENKWKIKKEVLARSLRWTVTDTALSPDQRFLVYSTINPVVHIVNIGVGETQSIANITEIHKELDFSIDAQGEFEFGLFSIKFSPDGQELIAGSNDCNIYIYDLQSEKLALELQAHKDEINTVAFADNTGNLIYSGSDDGICKVWDRRCLQTISQPAGSLVGHLEGITFIDSRGDGRHFISNGKDQTTKLWDIRKMSAGNPNVKSRNVPSFKWDYRWMEYPGTGKNLRHPCDQSLMTYTGHSVLQTLIRCYFSPVFSTAQKYVYSGSYDGCVYIYDLLSGKKVARLVYHSDAVRDCHWHPFYPTLVSSSWDGYIAEWDHGSEGGGKRRRSSRRAESIFFYN